MTISVKKISALALFVIFAPLCLCAEGKGADPAGTSEEEAVIARAIEGQERIFARDYPAAKAIFDELTVKHPDSPAGPFGNMAMLEVKMLEREDFHLQREFLKVTDEGISRVNRIMQRYDPSVWELFLSGSLLGLDGFYKARKGRWWDSYVQGGKSRQIFRRVKRMDPNFVDADFGLGMYIYWRSVFTRDLWFLKMFPDRRAEGVAIVERVTEKGNFAKELAKINLAIMYFEEKRFPDARRLLEEYARRFPDNIIVRRLYGKVLVSLKEYDSAVEQFRHMLRVAPELNKPRYFIGATLVIKGDPAGYPQAEQELKRFLKNEKGRYWPAHGRYWLGRLYMARGDKESAEREFAEAVKLYPDIENTLKRVRGMGGGV